MTKKKCCVHRDAIMYCYACYTFLAHTHPSLTYWEHYYVPIKQVYSIVFLYSAVQSGVDERCLGTIEAVSTTRHTMQKQGKERVGLVSVVYQFIKYDIDRILEAADNSPIRYDNNNAAEKGKERYSKRLCICFDRNADGTVDLSYMKTTV